MKARGPPIRCPGIKYDMTTFDEVISASTIAFMDKAKSENKRFFVWMNPTRAARIFARQTAADAIVRRRGMPSQKTRPPVMSASDA
jgi:hypothetical protein